MSFCRDCYLATLKYLFCSVLILLFCNYVWFRSFYCVQLPPVSRVYHTAEKMKFSIKDFFSKCDQVLRNLRIWSHLLKKSLMENLIFCTVSSTKLNQLIHLQPSVSSLWTSAFISAKISTTMLSSSAISYSVFTCQHIPIFIFSRSNKSAFSPSTSESLSHD